MQWEFTNLPFKHGINDFLHLFLSTHTHTHRDTYRHTERDTLASIRDVTIFTSSKCTHSLRFNGHFSR